MFACTSAPPWIMIGLPLLDCGTKMQFQRLYKRNATSRPLFVQGFRLLINTISATMVRNFVCLFVRKIVSWPKFIARRPSLWQLGHPKLDDLRGASSVPKIFLRIKLIKVHLFFSDMAHEMQFQATLVFFSKIFCQTSQVCPCRKKKAIIPRHPTNTTWTKCKKMIGTFFRGSLSFCVYTSTSLQFVRLVLVVLRE